MRLGISLANLSRVTPKAFLVAIDSPELKAGYSKFGRLFSIQIDIKEDLAKIPIDPFHHSMQRPWKKV